ncbi:hypothetical protein FRB97_005508 [Tulasnella sp. 331]|nr:hypothetical protein FRB97_005508 [Tulasnella sp. 331]
MLSDTVQYPTQQNQFLNPQLRYDQEFIPVGSVVPSSAFSPDNVHNNTQSVSPMTPITTMENEYAHQTLLDLLMTSSTLYQDTTPAVNWNSNPYQPMVGAYTATLTEGSDATPSTAWNDTPRTLYKTSPGTEVGDWDMAGGDSDEEDAVVKSRYYPSALAATTAVAWPHDMASVNSAFIPSSYDSHIVQASRDRFKDFTMQLSQNIRNAALFPCSTNDSFSPLFPSSTTNPITTASIPTPIPLYSSSPIPPQTTTTTTITHDVIAPPPQPQSQQQPQPLLRKPSLHLHKPAQPIDPFQRPSWISTRVDLAPVIIAPPMVASIALRRPLHPSGPTVSPKDLMLPTATFDFGFDPDAMVMTSVAEDDVEDLMDLGMSVGAVVAAADDENQAPTTCGDDIVESFVAGMTKRTRSSPAAQSLKRSYPEEQPSPVAATPAPAERRRRKFESASDAEGDSDGEYEETRRLRQQRPSKRIRQSPIASIHPTPSTVNSRLTATTTNTTTRAHQRSRHLQPNLVRNNACMHGCPLVFSTAYEARRHQEDAHGREEAYALISAASSSDFIIVYPRTYRFLMQIGIQSNGMGTWDVRVKEMARKALQHLDDHEDDTDADTPLNDELTKALVEFAGGWSKRYQCSGCGLGFSRLDSKKRHFEKGCPNRGG